MVTLAETKTEFNNWISEDATVSFLEKAQAGKTTLEDIADALDEFKRLHDANLASPAEIITLARAYPTNKLYTEAAEGLDEDEDTKPMVVGGPASVELVDREGHLITTIALKKAFKKFMKNFRARNVMVMHSDVQVGHALPAYISKSGNIFKSGVDDNGLFFISELRGDTKISKRVRDQIEKGGMSSYSIAGSATKSKDIKKSDGNSVLQVDDMELAEVTICEKGVNQGAHFELLKGDKASGSCADGSCMTKHSEPTPTVQTEYIAISKEDINSIDMFNNWISKAAPMMAGATAKLPKTTASPTRAANVTGGIGMPVKMSMEKKKEKVNPYAIATAMAKKKGFKNFSEDSKGDKYRDKITEGIKESNNMKKEFLSKQEPKRPKTKQPRKLGGVGAAVASGVKSLGAPTKRIKRGSAAEAAAAKTGGKILTAAGLGRSGKGRGTTGATRRALGAIGRKFGAGSSKRTTPRVGKRIPKLSGSAKARPTPTKRATPLRSKIGGGPKRKATPTAPKMQRMPSPKGQRGTPKRLGDLPKGRPQRLTGARGRMMENAIQKGDTMDITNIIKEAFNEIFMKDNGDTGVLAPAKRPKKPSTESRTYSQQEIDDLIDARLREQETDFGRDVRQFGERKETRERLKEDKQRRKVREALGSAPKPDTRGPAAERQQLAESAAARKRKFSAPEPVGMSGRSEFDPQSGQLSRRRDYESERQAARKNLGRLQSDYARTKERAGKGQTLATRYDPTSPAGSGSRPSTPKPSKKKEPSTATVSRREIPVPRKVAGSGREEQQMRRTGTTRPTTSSPTKKKFKPTKTGGKIGGVAARAETGRVKPPKTVTQKLGLRKPSAPKPKKKTMAQRGRGPGGAAASLAANRKEIARRQAAKKVTGGSATRMTEQG